jgi:CRP/FNR family transcriptional activator FtrB
VKAVPRETVLFQQGDVPRFLHIVLNGQVCLKAEDRRRRQTVLDVLNAGDILDVPTFFLSIPYMYSAVAMTPSRIMLVPCLACHRLLQEEPTWANTLMECLCRYYCEFIRQTIELKLGNIEERAANYILSRVDAHGAAATVVLSEGHGVVAQRLGMSPESFSRALRRLRRLGVETHGRQISIADTQRLREHYGAVMPNAD